VRITAEISLYPLRDDYLPKIEAFIRNVRRTPGLEIRINQMSTQVRGEIGEVMPTLQRAIEASFADGAAEVLVAKFLNADLPIGETPEVD
jgi:uncharacterized protein YqgV (UPF0045/DUF77 family)